MTRAHARRGLGRAEPAVVDPAARRPARRGHRRRAGRAAASDVEVRVVELRDHAHDVMNNLLTGFPSAGAAARSIDAVTGADGLIAVTPIFSASYSGLFKSFFDVLDDDALAGKPVLIARDRRHRPALAGAGARAAAAVRLPARGRRADRGLRRLRGLGRRPRLAGGRAHPTETGRAPRTARRRSARARCTTGSGGPPTNWRSR